MRCWRAAPAHKTAAARAWRALRFFLATRRADRAGREDGEVCLRCLPAACAGGHGIAIYRSFYLPSGRTRLPVAGTCRLLRCLPATPWRAQTQQRVLVNGVRVLVCLILPLLFHSSMYFFRVLYALPSSLLPSAFFLLFVPAASCTLC